MARILASFIADVGMLEGSAIENFGPILLAYLETGEDDHLTRMRKMNELLAGYRDFECQPVPPGHMKCLGFWSGDTGKLLSILQTHQT